MAGRLFLVFRITLRVSCGGSALSAGKDSCGGWTRSAGQDSF